MKKSLWIGGLVVLVLALGIFWWNRGQEPVYQSVESQTEAVQPIDVSLVIDGQTYPESVPAGSSALDLMNHAQAEGDIEFSGTDYDQLGFLIESINGVASSDNNYWSLYVNGEMAQVGVSSQQIAAGDKIEWKYEEISF